MKHKKYWKDLEEYENKQEFDKKHSNEFKEELPLEDILSEKEGSKKSGRRDFLKMMGFSLTAATVAASCEIPVKKAIPYVIKPEEVTPGKANYYASTYSQDGDYCSVLVKVRDGRPIKIEGNELSSMTKGGTNARAQASVLSLYDNNRLRNPLKNGKKTEWDNIDAEIVAALGASQNVRILSSTIISPSSRQVIRDFADKFTGTKHVAYDPVSYSGMLDANKRSFGKRVLPSYHFDKADVVVSFGADFLGTWISPVEFTKQYSDSRKLDPESPKMSRHVQFEAGMSLTGTNADLRLPLKPSKQGLALLNLYNKLSIMAGKEQVSNVPEFELPGNSIAKTATELWGSKGKALVVCGSNDPDIQQLVNEINRLLGSYGNTIDISTPSYQRQGDDQALMALVEEMNSGVVDTLILYDVNPVYDFPGNKSFADALKKVNTTIALSYHPNETASEVKYVCPIHHYLESWGDAEPKKGIYSFIQPTIAPLFDTRLPEESLLNWAGMGRKILPAASAVSDTSKTFSTADTLKKVTEETTPVGVSADVPDDVYLNYLKKQWKKISGGQNGSFNEFWTKFLHDGVYYNAAGSDMSEGNETSTEGSDNAGLMGVADLGTSILSNHKPNEDNVDIELYEKIGVGNGQHANNPWLQELPDPVTKVTWDNYITASPTFAKEKGWETGNMLKVSVDGHSVELPLLIQPGQAYGTLSVAVGYGRTKAGKAGDNVGKNVYPLAEFRNGTIQYYRSDASVEAAGGKDYPFARTQTHHSYEGRPIIKESTFDKYKNDRSAGNEDHQKIQEMLAKNPSMYPKHPKKGHHWAMVVDLNACTGCGACVVACNAENNVPVVGKEEVRRVHEMHWLRIDRYYSYKETAGDSKEEMVETVHQPMLCQHCDNAPCENVCPVAATNHSSEGINQMAYNRCVGTRYCANNCPYKVRRFNWYDYFGADSFPGNRKDPADMSVDLTRMVLNPDVVVRSRGVMEKCTFCIQRIQAGKLDAKTKREKLKDGAIKTACQQACPAGAIKFGDQNDPNSEVSKLFENKRNYFVLAEIHTLPSVGYLTKIKNVRDKDMA